MKRVLAKAAKYSTQRERDRRREWRSRVRPPVCPKCVVETELNIGYGYVCGTCGWEPER